MRRSIIGGAASRIEKGILMTAWRPVRGTITRLDPDFTSEADIQDIFAQERILGRGGANAAYPAQFDFELAIAGRKRRVATLDESGELFRGRSLDDLAAYLHEHLSKVEVEIAGTVLHGPMDIGAVAADVDDTDVVAGEVPDTAVESDNAAAAGETATAAEAETGAAAAAPAANARDGQAGNGDNPAWRGPSFVLADIATSQVPVLAAAAHTTIGALKLDELKLLVAEEAMDVRGRGVMAPDFSLTFAYDSATNEPVLTVQRNGRTAHWVWDGELPGFAWVAQAEVPAAADFVHSELGAGGMARMAVADMVAATFVQVREALLVEPAQAALSLVTALGLPNEVAKVMTDAASISMVPGIRLFEPRDAASTFTEALAWEVAGEGHVNSGLADDFRALYLKRPWLTAMVAAAQAAVGGAMFMSGAKAHAGEKHPRLKIAVGGLLVASALSRIATIEYMNSAIERFVGNLSGEEFAADSEQPDADSANAGADSERAAADSEQENE